MKECSVRKISNVRHRNVSNYKYFKSIKCFLIDYQFYIILLMNISFRHFHQTKITETVHGRVSAGKCGANKFAGKQF